jgi:hypothetical protein
VIDGPQSCASDQHHWKPDLSGKNAHICGPRDGYPPSTSAFDQRYIRLTLEGGITRRPYYPGDIDRQPSGLRSNEWRSCQWQSIESTKLTLLPPTCCGDKLLLVGADVLAVDTASAATLDWLEGKHLASKRRRTAS